MNKRRELKGKADVHKGNVLHWWRWKWRVFFFGKKRKFQKKPTQIFNEKMKNFVMKWKKQEVREKTVSFFFFKKKETAKTEIVQKNVLFGMTGRYVEGENKGQKKRTVKCQIKENLQKRDSLKKDNCDKKPRQWNCHAFTIKEFHDPNAKKSMSAACHETRV